MAIVVIFPSGSAVANEVCLALRAKRIVSKLIGLSSNDREKDLTNPSLYNHVYYNAPTVNEASLDIWIKYLNQFGWTHLVPTMDCAVYLFSKLAPHFSDRWFLAPSIEACDICFSKRKTYLTWPSVSPKLFDNSRDVEWYVKPDIGYASRGCREITFEEAEILHSDPQLVVCERLLGDEFTIHCYSSTLIGVRRRTITKAGMSMLTHNTDPVPRAYEIFDLIIDKIRPPLGPWFFQIKGNRLLEVQPRIPGAGSAARYLWSHNGILQWLYDTQEGRLDPSIPLPNRLFMKLPIRAVLKTFQDYLLIDDELFRLEAVVVDYDDTLFDTRTNSVDADLISALYAIHRKLPIYLVTRHRGDLQAHMNSNAISFELFDKILHVTDERQTKWEAYVALNDARNAALLIDDSYRDRNEWESWSCDRDEGALILRCWKSNIPLVSPNYMIDDTVKNSYE